MPTFIPHAEWSTSGLISSIQRNALLPTNQDTFLPADFIQMMNEEVQNRIVPLIVGYHANYFRRSVLIPLLNNQSKALTVGSASAGGNNVGYAIPADAIGKKMINVSVINNNGDAWTLPMVTRWEVGSPTRTRGCFVEGDILYLYPANSFNGFQSIQIDYLGAPLALCDDTGTAAANVASSAVITGLNTTTGAVTLSVVPPSITANAAVNFIGAVPQFNTNAVTTVSAVSGNVIMVPATALFDSFGRQVVNVGDWVANAGYSPFLQMPVEARNLVTQATIAKTLKAMKDLDGANSAEGDYVRMAADSAKIFSPRIDDSPKILTSAGRGIGSQRRWGPWSAGN